MNKENIVNRAEGIKASTGPSTEDDWTIHSINIHGVFYERWCQKVILDSGGWTIKSTNYPVEFPPPNGPFRGKESHLDIRSEYKHRDCFITLLVECKKNNPDFTNWIFFPKYPDTSPKLFVASLVDNIINPQEKNKWSAQFSLFTSNSKQQIYTEARETKGSYINSKKGDKTKTSNAAITDAANQIALATQAIVNEEARFSNTLGSSGKLPERPWIKQCILPIIVTSAKLFACEFDPADVNPSTGEIPYDKCKIIEKPDILYEYPLPKHLQYAPVDLTDALLKGAVKGFINMHIMVVHSESFNKFLNILRSEADELLGLPKAN